VLGCACWGGRATGAAAQAAGSRVWPLATRRIFAKKASWAGGLLGVDDGVYEGSERLGGLGVLLGRAAGHEPDDNFDGGLGRGRVDYAPPGAHPLGHLPHLLGKAGAAGNQRLQRRNCAWPETQ
jgi:hypothetical protein